MTTKDEMKCRYCDKQEALIKLLCTNCYTRRGNLSKRLRSAELRLYEVQEEIRKYEQIDKELKKR